MNTVVPPKRAKDIMSSPVITVRDDVAVKDIAGMMLEKGIGALVVVDAADRAIGLISESDIAGIRRSLPFSLSLAPMLIGAKIPSESELKQLFAQGAKLAAKQVMSHELLSVTEETTVNEVLHLMIERNVKHLPVIKNGKAEGIIARHDLLRFFALA